MLHQFPLGAYEMGGDDFDASATYNFAIHYTEQNKSSMSIIAKQPPVERE